MKIRIEIDPDVDESEVVIRCSRIDESVAQIQSLLLDSEGDRRKIVFYKDDTEFYFSSRNTFIYLIIFSTF